MIYDGRRIIPIAKDQNIIVNIISNIQMKV
jgi:hypothetical protein